MPTPQLPGYAASPLTPTGHLSKEWYRYLKWVGERDTSAEADSEDTEYKLVGPLSIVVSGLLQNGLASVALKNDQLAPEATSYYGTDDSGTKGWHLVGDALDVTADLTKAVDGTTNVVTFGLADLADSGVGAALVKITRDAKGRVEGTEAANLADLADVAATAPSDGQVLTFDTTNGWQPETPAAGSGGAMTHVGTATVAGAAATSITLSGLDLAADQCYRLEIALKNATASTAAIALFYNGDTTTTNYHRQLSTLIGSATPVGSRINSANVVGLSGSGYTEGSASILNGRDGKPVAHLHVARDRTTNFGFQQCSHHWVTTANVTSITISSDVAAALDIGSYFKVFKVVG